MTLIKPVTGAAALGAAMLIGCGLLAPPAQAAYTVTLAQQGRDVVANGSGTLDLSGLTRFRGVGDPAEIHPQVALIFTGPTVSSSAETWSIPTGPRSFGSGGSTPADSGSGDFVGLAVGLAGLLYVPDGYISGHSLSDTSTYDNATFATLGVTPGTYTWTWASDSFTLQIGPAAVPEPSGLALLALPLGLVMLAAARRAVCA